MHPSCCRPVSWNPEALSMCSVWRMLFEQHPCAPEVGQKLPETCWVDWNINKFLLLHLVGLLHYLYQWCTVKQTSKIQYQRLQNLVWMSYSCLCWLRNHHSQRSDKSVARPWRESMPFAFRTHWWRKIQYLGLNKQYRKKDSEGSQFLKDIFGLSLLPPAEVSDWFAFDFISNLTNNRRVEQCWDCLPEN